MQKTHSPDNGDQMPAPVEYSAPTGTGQARKGGTMGTACGAICARCTARQHKERPRAGCLKGEAPTKEYSKYYRAVFDFHKEYSPFPRTLEEWEAAASEMCAISNAHDNNPFIMALLCAVWEELERSEQQAAGQ